MADETQEAARFLTDFSAGSRIAGYRLEERIGQGATAVVFRAKDERLRRPVALKILSPALALYRQHFRPSAALERPYAMVAAAVVCAGTDERARFLAGSGALSFLRLRSGRPGPLPSPEEAAAYPYSDLERAFIEDRQASQIIGSPGTVQRGMAELLEATAADELMITTMVFDPADRLTSFSLVADLARASAGAAASR